MRLETIFAYIDTLEEELIGIRRDFHQHPEVLYDVVRTSGKVAEMLEAWGLEVERNVGRHFGMGVVATLRGGRPGKTVLLRADMDALPIQELNELAYKSKHPGKMHACGHDVHTAMLLGAAKALSQYQSEVPGTVKFVFQPAEEGAEESPIDGRLLSGGRDMIEAGILDNVDIGFALHVLPEIPVGAIGVHPRYAMAASSHFKVEFHGKSGHHSTPHLAADAIVMASRLVVDTKVMMANEINPAEAAVLAFGSLHAGTVPNVIADHSELAGTYRAFGKDTVAAITDGIQRHAEAIAQAYGGTYSFRLREGIAVQNEKEAVQCVLRAGRRIFGEAGAFELEQPSLAGEDFGWYLDRIPGAFAFIGCGNREQGIVHSIHHPHFNVDERVLSYGAKVHVQLVLEANV